MCKPGSGPQKPSAETYPLIRRFAVHPGQKLTDQILQLNGNIDDTRGTGGTCFGDSGAPTLLNGYVVTVTSYAICQCKALDRSGVRGFLYGWTVSGCRGHRGSPCPHRSGKTRRRPHSTGCGRR